MKTNVPIAITFAALLTACNKNETPVTNAAAPMASASSLAVPLPTAGTAPASDTIPTRQGDLKIVPLRHATVLLDWAGKTIYVDPAADAKYDGLPKADVILVTDVHADHMSPPTIELLRKPETTVVVPAAVATNLPPAGRVTIANGESRTVAGFDVDAVPMYNIQRGPSAGQFYHDKGRGNGYVLTLGGKRVYLSGDTECTPEMKALKKIDIAFVCMNLPYTMPPSEAAECIKGFKPKIVYPYHYRGSNLDELVTALASEKRVEVRVRNWYP